MSRAGEPIGISALDEERVAALIKINLLEERGANPIQVIGLKQRVSELSACITKLRATSRCRETRKPAG